MEAIKLGHDPEMVGTHVLIVRKRRIILDVDLARLYGVSTGALNQAVKRNLVRFPDDFMFLLTKQEQQEVITACDNLRSIKYAPAPPRAFTEHGAIMVAAVLNSPRAIAMSTYLVRAFVRLREFAGVHRKLAAQLAEIERRVGVHDENIDTLFDAMRQLLNAHERKKNKIGFNTGGD
jgi:hypothetical protein